MKTCNFDGATMRVLDLDTGIWIRGNDVAAILGYSRPRDAIHDNILPEHKRPLNSLLPTAPLNGNERRATYINVSGLRTLIACSQRPNKEPFIEFCREQFGIGCHVVTRLRKEQEYIGYIIKVFEHKGPRTQFPVERYRIDLYFPAERVAVECDEYGHRDRCPVQEATREQFIAARLGCRFVRFNPDAPAFCVFDTIREIMQALDVSP